MIDFSLMVLYISSFSSCILIFQAMLSANWVFGGTLGLDLPEPGLASSCFGTLRVACFTGAAADCYYALGMEVWT